MDDTEAMQLLRLLHKYVTDHDIRTDDTIADVADDLAMSMDVTTDEADNIRKELGNQVKTSKHVAVYIDCLAGIFEVVGPFEAATLAQDFVDARHDFKLWAVRPILNPEAKA